MLEKSIIFIIPYFGTWPVWFDAFLISCKANANIDWLFFTDCNIKIEVPENVKLLSSTLEEIKELSEQALGSKIVLTSARKLCDLRPAYGYIFKDYIKDYEFWGFCDVDIIWGDINQFITQSMLREYDVISSRYQNISGHFTIMRNVNEVNFLFKNIKHFREKLLLDKNQRIDEIQFTKDIRNKEKDIKIFWDTILCNQERGRDSHQEYYLDRWQWQNGKMINTKTGEEVMYLHFINWKRTMKYNEVKYFEHFPNHFYISYNGMHFKRHSRLAHILNNIKNVFNGYYVRIKRKLYVRKFNRFKYKLIVKFKRN